MDGCFFCWVIKEKREGGLHAKCEDHTEIWLQKDGARKLRALARRQSILRSFLARTEAGEYPVKVQRDLMLEYGYKTRTAIDRVIKTTRLRSIR